MSHTQTQKVINRLAKIEGHVRAINEMLQADRACPDLLVQIVAVRSALNKVAQIILADHAEHCIVKAAQEGNYEPEMARFSEALDLLMRSSN